MDIVRASDTTVVVLVPESGDSIQAMKAGLMEIADFFVVNKADRVGADQAVMSIKMVLNFKPQADGWKADVIQTVANEGKGIDLISEKIAAHRAFLEKGQSLTKKREDRILERIRDLVGDRLRVEFWNDERKELLASKIEQLVFHQTTPYDIVEQLLEYFKQ